MIILMRWMSLPGGGVGKPSRKQILMEANPLLEADPILEADSLLETNSLLEADPPSWRSNLAL